MNKLTKAAIATAAGVALLMGGAGTLAYWSATPTIGGSGTITAGQLAAVSNNDGQWHNGSATGPNISLASFTIVPGDTLTYTETVKLSATGTNLKFTAALGSSTLSGTGSPNSNLVTALGGSATVTTTVAGSNLAGAGTVGSPYTVTTAGDSVVTVTSVVKWNSGTTAADNLAQKGVATLAAATLTFTQVP